MVGKILFFCSLSFISLFSQDFRTKNELVSIDSIISAERVESIKNQTGQISQIENILNQYFSQNKIEPILYENNFSINEIRLFDLKKSLSYSPSYLIKNSPILFELYAKLGDEYKKQENEKKSLQSFLTALRYRKLTLTEDAYLTEEPINEILPLNAQNLNQHKSLKENLDNKKKEITTLKVNQYKKEAALVRGNFNAQDIQKDLYLNNLSELNRQLEELENQYEDSYETVFTSYKNEVEKKNSDVIFSLAQLVKNVESKNQKDLDIQREKIRAEKNTIFDFKKNKDFPAYQQLLKLAHRLNENNKEILLELSRDLKNTYKLSEAIEYFNKYLSIEEDLNSDFYKDSLKDLAYLYESDNQFIKATQFYEKYYFSEKDAEKIKNILFQLGYLFDNEIGNFDKSFYYYEKWLENISREEFNLEQNSSEILKQVEALFLFSKYYKKKNKLEDELQSLTRVFNLYEDLKDIVIKNREKLKEKEKELESLEENIKKSKDTGEIYSLRDKYENEKKNKNALSKNLFSSQSMISSLIEKKPFLERLAEINKENRDYQAAKTYYQEIINNSLNIGKKQTMINYINEINQIEEAQN